MSVELETIEGEVRRVRRWDTGYTVVRLDTGEGADLTLVGSMPPLDEGMRIEADCEATQHATYGLQYKVHEVREKGFSSTEALVGYLASDRFHNIGLVTARLIVKTFGQDTMKVLDSDPGRILEVPGIQKQRIEPFLEAWKEGRAEHRAIAKLIGFGMTANLAMKVHKFFDGKAVETIEVNPYTLTQVPGVGFNKADEIALASGVDRQSQHRVKSATEYALQESQMAGHCYLILSILTASVVDVLKKDVGQLAVESAIKGLVKEQSLIVEDSRVYLSELYYAERMVADLLLGKLKYEASPLYETTAELQAKLEELREDGDIVLAEEQLNAVFAALNNRVTILTGPPGSGKSTITKIILRMYAHHEIDYTLCSPTGRAAKRMTEVTGEGAKTIHRTLMFDPESNGFYHRAGRPLHVDCVVVDESSMLDIKLFRDLISATEKQTRILLIGDADQLPSVGAGNVLRDLIGSGTIATVRLDKIFRQVEGSSIINVSRDILKGIPPTLPTPAKARKGESCMFVGAEEHDVLISHMLTLITKSLPSAGYKFDDIQVLTPMRGRGVGVEDLNPRIQEVLNPEEAGKPEIIAGKRIFRVGDRIMQIRNNYKKGENGVFNGDVGNICGISNIEGKHTVFVKYPDMADPVSYTPDEWDELQHSFAMTVHKAQGAEYPVVILVMHSSQYNMLQRNLFYTGLTRGKKLCIVAGTQRAIEIAVLNGQEQKRNTTLKEFLA